MPGGPWDFFEAQGSSRHRPDSTRPQALHSTVSAGGFYSEREQLKTMLCEMFKTKKFFVGFVFLKAFRLLFSVFQIVRPSKLLFSLQYFQIQKLAEGLLFSVSRSTDP